MLTSHDLEIKNRKDEYPMKDSINNITNDKESELDSAIKFMEKAFVLLNVNWMKTKEHIFHLFQKETSNYQLTRKDLSQIFNVSEVWIKQVLNTNSDSPIPYKEIIKFSYILNVPIQQLLILKINEIDDQTINDIIKILMDDVSSILENQNEKLIIVFKCVIQMLKSYRHLKNNYILSTDCLIYTFPLLNEEQMYDIFSRIAGHNNSKYYERYIANFLLHKYAYNERKEALDYFEYLIKRYYCVIDTPQFMYEQQGAFFNKIKEFQNSNHFKNFIKHISFSKKVLNNHDFKPLMSYHNIIQYFEKEDKQIKMIHSSDYSLLFKTHWKQTKKNIRYLLEEFVEEMSGDINESLLRKYLQVIQKLLGIKTDLYNWLSSDQSNNNEKVLYHLLKLFPHFSSEVISYNYECDEYQLLLDKYKKEMAKTTFNTECDSKYQYYKSMMKKENTYSIADIFMLLPLLSKKDLFHLKDQFKENNLGFQTLNAQPIVDYIVTCAHNSTHVKARDFVFELIKFFHRNKFLQLTEGDPTIELIKYKPELADGADEFLELSERFQYIP